MPRYRVRQSTIQFFIIEAEDEDQACDLVEIGRGRELHEDFYEELEAFVEEEE